MRSTILILLSLLAAAVAAPRAQELPEESRACPVAIDGRVLFEVTNVEGGRVTAEQRAEGITARLVEVARDRTIATPSVRAVSEAGGVSLFVGDQLVMVVRPSDAAHNGVSLDRCGELLVPILERAILDYRGDRSAPRLLRALAGTALVVLAAALVLFLYSRLYRHLRRWVLHGTAKRLARVEHALSTTVELGQMRSALALALSTANMFVWLVAISATVDVCLSFFPQTRWISAQMLGLAADPLAQTGRAIVASIPSLIFVAVVVMVTRVLLRVNEGVFSQLERGQLVIQGFYPEWARPTCRIISIALVVAAVVVAFPYVPGSSSAAFKSISILLGVVVSLGSSSVISNFLNGLLLSYMRAFRPGDVVRIGDTVGTVLESGLMVTRVRTLREIEIAIPNVTIMNDQVTNYSSAGVALVSTAVTIGYGTPWRQVQAMLELAAAQTEELRRDPAPFVLQSGLEDFYIRYELWVALEDPWRLPRVMAALHANIQDQFNEHGVQIMSPHYMADPPEPAVVPKEQWRLPPAK